MKNFNKTNTVTNPVFSAVKGDKNVNLASMEFHGENQSFIKAVFQLIALMLTLPTITYLLLTLLKMN